MPDPEGQEPEDASPLPEPEQPQTAPEQPVFYSAGFRARRKKNRLPWIITGASALVVALIIVLVVSLTGDDDVDTSTPQGLAESVVNDYNHKDFDGAAELQCVKTAVEDTSGMRTIKQAELEVTLGDVQVDGSRATAIMHVDASLQGHHINADATISMKQLGNYWCISAISRR